MCLGWFQQWEEDKEAESKSDTACSAPEAYGWCLYALDHMRDRKRYIESLSSWAKQLNLLGSVLFYKKKIRVALWGERSAIQTYLKWSRTETVDIDSRGRKCKEK